MVRPGSVVALVTQEQHMTVGVRAEDVVWEPVRLRPSMFSIVVAGSAADFREALVVIDINDVVGVAGVFVCQIQDVPSVDVGRRVGKPRVVVDDGVQRGAQGRRVGSVNRVVVAVGWIGEGGARNAEQ